MQGIANQAQRNQQAMHAATKQQMNKQSNTRTAKQNSIANSINSKNMEEPQQAMQTNNEKSVAA